MAGLRLLIFFVAAIPLLSVDAAAQDYRSWDRNNDGIISRAEWRGTVQDFRDRDLNRDGMLSGNELGLWIESDNDTIGTFASLDRNGNGVISRGEWRGNRNSFLRADRNGDNQISRAEFMNSNAGNVVDNDLDFDALDDDGSGRIDRNEWRGTRPAFNRLDVNRDGVLSRREFMSDAVIASGETNRDPVEEVFAVDSRQEWSDTGFFVDAGDIVTFRGQGTIQMMMGADDRATPAGSVTGRSATNSPRPDLRAGTLLVRIGNQIEASGQSGSFRARNSGRLYLGVNDDHFADNSGEYRVRVSVTPR